MFLLAVAGAAAAQQPPRRLEVRFPAPPAVAEGFDNFRRALATAVERRDAAFVHARVSPQFHYERDFGGMFDPATTAVVNFSNVFVFDESRLLPEYAGHGWARFARLLSAQRLELVAGEVCGPAWPTAESVAPIERHDEDFWFAWGYVDGRGVRLRAAPSTRAPVRRLLSLEAVKVTGQAPLPDAAGQAQRWLVVATPDGQDGYVAADLIEGFLGDRLCYRQDAAGRWQIAAYIGGGD